MKTGQTARRNNARGSSPFLALLIAVDPDKFEEIRFYQEPIRTALSTMLRQSLIDDGREWVMSSIKDKDCVKFQKHLRGRVDSVMG